MTSKSPSPPRACALVGPFAGGKTSLLEAMLFACGAIGRQGRIKDGSTTGDSSPEARAHAAESSRPRATRPSSTPCSAGSKAMASISPRRYGRGA